MKENNLRDDYFMIPLSFVYKIKKDKDSKYNNTSLIEIYSKDGRRFICKLIEKCSGDGLNYVLCLQGYIFNYNQGPNFYFAYEFYKYNRTLEETYKGWKIYDIKREFEREGLPPLGYKYIDNTKYQICSTYPYYIVVPRKITESNINSGAKFRTSERFPAISYYYNVKKSVLSRGSQVKSGFFANRCAEDELLLQLIGNPNYKKSIFNEKDINVKIFDARPYLKAFANKVNGKGYENIKFYNNCEILFMDIENIHHVNKVHSKLLQICNQYHQIFLLFY